MEKTEKPMLQERMIEYQTAQAATADPCEFLYMLCDNKEGTYKGEYVGGKKYGTFELHKLDDRVFEIAVSLDSETEEMSEFRTLFEGSRAFSEDDRSVFRLQHFSASQKESAWSLNTYEWNANRDSDPDMMKRVLRYGAKLAYAVHGSVEHLFRKVVPEMESGIEKSLEMDE